MRHVKLKLKGGIILPEKLDKATRDEVKKRTAEAIISGIQKMGVSNVALDIDTTGLTPEQTKRLERQQEQQLNELVTGADDSKDTSKMDKILLAQNRQTQKKIKEEQKEVLKEITAKTGVIDADLKKIINDALANGTSADAQIKGVAAALTKLGADASDIKNIVDTLTITSGAQNQTRRQKLESLRDNLKNASVKVPNVLNSKNNRLLQTLIDDKDFKNVTQNDINDMNELVTQLEKMNVVGQDAEEAIFGPNDNKTKYWKFKNIFMNDVQRIRTVLANTKTTKAQKEADLKALGVKKADIQRLLQTTKSKKKADVDALKAPKALTAQQKKELKAKLKEENEKLEKELTELQKNNPTVVSGKDEADEIAQWNNAEQEYIGEYKTVLANIVSTLNDKITAGDEPADKQSGEDLRKFVNDSFSKHKVNGQIVVFRKVDELPINKVEMAKAGKKKGSLDVVKYEYTNAKKNGTVTEQLASYVSRLETMLANANKLKFDIKNPADVTILAQFASGKVARAFKNKKDKYFNEYGPKEKRKMAIPQEDLDTANEIAAIEAELSKYDTDLATELAKLDTDPAYDDKQFDPQITKEEADLLGLTAREAKEQGEEVTTLQDGWGLPKKRKGKGSGLAGLTLDDISNAIFEKIKKKKNDKRHLGNNKYSGFQIRNEKGHFTGGIISNASDIESQLMKNVASGKRLQAMRMLEASQDVFSKADYERLMAKIMKP